MTNLFHKKTSRVIDDVRTIVSKDSVLEGSLNVKEGTLRVDGVVKNGVIKGEGVVVGKTASIYCDIYAKEVVIAGNVIGDVFAEYSVEILAKGVLTGNIKTKRLKIEYGTKFTGHCEMSLLEEISASEPERDQETIEHKF